LLAVRSLSDPDASNEVVQETIARALKALAEGRLRNPDHLGAYVRGIARHVIADVHRSRALSPITGTDPEGLPSSRSGALEQIISAEERQRLRFALNAISEPDREILRLCFHEGLTPGEIAERLGMPSERIRKRKSRALERLRRVFLAGGHD
jgi:RNA polymerase sigma factor (sigma-70 family)